MSNFFRLGVNIDHVATLKRLRDTPYPALLKAAEECVRGGADQITVHLREDRRHIVDQDVLILKEHLAIDLNLEMAATAEMFDFALMVAPHSVCIVPEKREERTTEGGLDLSLDSNLKRYLPQLNARNIVTSLFIEPDQSTVQTAYDLGAKAVELHTGSLCLKYQRGDRAGFEKGLQELQAVAAFGQELGLMVHAGHGIDYEIAPRLAQIGEIFEYNIGHSIVCEAIFVGIAEATRKMKALLKKN